MSLSIPTSLAPMEALLVPELPRGPEWQYEPKWDGFRCLAYNDGPTIELRSKSGQPFNRYFPEIVTALARLKAQRFVLDGELVVPVDSALSFDQLLQRIHPARSRVDRLSREHPALFIVFDLLAAKEPVVGSLLLGLYNADGELDHVGFAANIKSAERPALTRRLERLVEPPGFTGRAPGGPSRWSNERSADWKPLAPVLVAEVQYDHFSGERFRHGTRFLRWRPDKPPQQCVIGQVAQGSANSLALLGKNP